VFSDKEIIENFQRLKKNIKKFIKSKSVTLKMLKNEMEKTFDNLGRERYLL
jgi:hypothetical protein